MKPTSIARCSVCSKLVPIVSPPELRADCSPWLKVHCRPNTRVTCPGSRSAVDRPGPGAIAPVIETGGQLKSFSDLVSAMELP